VTETTDTRLRKAIDNNHGLYQAILVNHGVPFTIDKEIAYTLNNPPPLYSNLVTRSRMWRPDTIFNEINGTAEEEHWSGWSIKDSFDVLDLVPYGFEKLFNAQWIHLPAEKFTQVGSGRTSYRVLRTSDELSDWISAWGGAEVTQGDEIFHPRLLENPSIHFVGGYESGKLICGCLVNATDDVLGISNFFAPLASASLLSNVLEFIFDAVGKRDVVGYKRHEFAEELGVLGFEAVGDLAVWLKQLPRAS
jgi:hypothetical protein